MENKWKWDVYFRQGGQRRPRKVSDVEALETDSKDKEPAGRRYREQGFM